MSVVDDQQFCLRWNNFQANITSQFETLRDDEDFTDVTIACEGQQLQAHKIILSACSPLFKELFKSNPCPHPIIFMRDVEAQHIVALMEFMYAGEVNVAQAQLSAFLKTAESLKIRGLTDTSNDLQSNKEENMVFLNPQPSNVKSRLTKTKISSCSSTVTSSQDINPSSPPPTKKACQMGKNNVQLIRDQDASFEIETHINLDERNVAPKVELPEYLSDDDGKEDGCSNFNSIGDITELTGGMEIIPTHSSFNAGQNQTEGYSDTDRFKRRKSSEQFLPFASSPETTFSDTSSRLRDVFSDRDRRRLVKLGEGIEICEEQLRSVKWSDYRKLTRGLATILFSPTELASCSVTGQRWSRAGTGERPVKPALDRAKVQAIISYVATRFPMIEISRIKQVLAYKCKENSTAFKMKAVRYYGDQLKVPDGN
ncbi:hypothetical protein PPYR_04284 [Photinus pyralis]|uniref:BTB domain-containing protein n=1 Tax=Photinus pyralis TaxID=7054 RepID=A0A5N4AXX8_PHOPY|nr:B-cell CLL/lymphoma 6 member B protein-like isoform X1 [Photinus pyralis]KAB0802098.1 hypothetical protein PPYR_04284 [Photinus pyralis]